MRNVPLLVCLLALCAHAADWPQWRGPNRDGISKETGLLKEWPKDGPKLVWQLADLGVGAGRGAGGVGVGWGAVAVVGDRIYLTGNKDGQEFGAVRGAKDGKVIWTTPLGKVG